jgi:hypothetical protein
MTDGLERIWKEVIMAQLWYWRGICLEGPRNRITGVLVKI